MKVGFLKSLMLLASLNYSYKGYADWQEYVDCNNGALSLDFAVFQTSRGEWKGHQAVIRDQGVVSYLKSKVPDLVKKEANSPLEVSIFKPSGEIIFRPDETERNWRFKNSQEDSFVSLIDSLKVVTDNSGRWHNTKSVFISLSRLGTGVRTQFMAVDQQGIRTEIANWYFENCTRLNTGVSSHDPLGFWDLR